MSRTACPSVLLILFTSCASCLVPFDRAVAQEPPRQPKPAHAADERFRPKPRQGNAKPPARVEEMCRWLSREQQSTGAWTYRLRLVLEYQIHEQSDIPLDYQEKSEDLWPGEPFDTGMAGLALLRAGHRPGSGKFGETVRRAAEYLYREVQSSPETTCGISSKPTAFSARIGPHCDAFLALHFFVELQAAGGPRYELAIQRLLTKIVHSQHPDGSWDDEQSGGSNAPLLGHALAVRALEAASRAGEKVPAEVLAKAGQYAMSVEAEKREWKRNGKWKKDPRAPRPQWLRQGGTDDDDPINFTIYVMAARLSVLYETDRSNRLVFEREAARLGAAEARGTRPTPAELNHLRALREATKATSAALEQGRDTMRKTWTKVNERDIAPSPGPILFTGEDFLASLLVVDAMGECKDVEHWFLPVAQRLMYFQDIDGGLRYQELIDCEHPHIRDCCYAPFKGFPAAAA